MPHAWRSPPAAFCQLPSMRVGEVLLVPPSPSWPQPSAPQHHSVASSLIAQLWLPPLPSSIHLCLPNTSTGVGTAREPSRVTCPSALAPKQNTLPAVVRAHV